MKKILGTPIMFLGFMLLRSGYVLATVGGRVIDDKEFINKATATGTRHLFTTHGY